MCGPLFGNDSPAIPVSVWSELVHIIELTKPKDCAVKLQQDSASQAAGGVHLTVSDLGAGFDIEGAMNSTGLGLTSMQERLRLVDRELSINSQPKGGTTIHACVPFDSSSDSATGGRVGTAD
jgi:signal transduction histidine kinase